MPFARPLGMFIVLAVLGLSPGCNPVEPGPLALPELEQTETTAGAPYVVSLAATGGVPPLRYSLEKLPPGFTFFTDTGQFQGPARIAGTYTFTLYVRDSAGTEVERSYSLLVYPSPEVGSSPLPAATQGQTYAFHLMANGGKAPLSWTLAGGTLPTGLSVDADGQLEGVPRTSGSYAPLLRVKDANGASAERVLGLEVRAGPSGEDAGTDAGTTVAFTAANWNLEWFGSPSEGPADDTLQRENVRTVMSTVGADFWGLQELVDGAQFNALKQAMPGYDGFMANDPGIPSGSTYYSVGEQKPGILFRSDVVSVLEKKLIPVSSADLYAFGSRPPLQVKLRITRDGASVDLVAIVLHMKAFADRDSYDRRQNAAVALKKYLDAQLPNTPFLVLGDWNDDVDVSITFSTSGGYLPTPYQNFLDAPTGYTFLTQPLSVAKLRSTVSNAQFIDHQLASNELRMSYVNNSAQVLRPDAYIPNYKATTTDHYPVLSRFEFHPEGAP